MKQIILNFLTFSIFSIGFSQRKENLEEFSKVTAFDKITVTLIKSTENKIIIQGNNADEIELVYNENELKIRLPFGKNLKGDNISATVFYVNLEAVEANEGSSILSDNKIDATLFEIICKEGSDIKLTDLQVNKLNANIASGATVFVAGTAESQDIVTSAGGKFNGKSFKTETTTVSVNAGGFADVYATQLVEAKTRAGGTITIYGKPKQINEKKILGGTIVQGQ